MTCPGRTASRSRPGPAGPGPGGVKSGAGRRSAARPLSGQLRVPAKYTAAARARADPAWRYAEPRGTGDGHCDDRKRPTRSRRGRLAALPWIPARPVGTGEERRHSGCPPASRCPAGRPGLPAGRPATGKAGPPAATRAGGCPDADRLPARQPETGIHVPLRASVPPPGPARRVPATTSGSGLIGAAAGGMGWTGWQPAAFSGSGRRLPPSLHSRRLALFRGAA